MRQDAEYAQTRVRDGWRLWIDGEPRPPQDPHSMIVAEVPYNVVTVGPETDVVCRLQEDARLIFDAPAFVADYERLDADQRRLEKDLGASKRLRRRYGKLGAFLLEMRFVYEQARDLKKPVVIRSGFFKVMNRRYCPETFWVMEVSGKISGVLADVHPFTEWDEPEDEVSTYVLSSARSRWFSAPTRLTSRQALVHADISSSQSQIVAIFWGLRELEALAVTKRSPLKKHLAASAWEHRAVVLKPGYEEGDPRLVEAVKNLWMRIGYGSTVWTVIKDQRKDPETYGPGWTDGAKVQAWLSTIPGYDGMTAARRACQWLGNHADLYAGLEMVDPLDGARHTWNPIERADVKLRLNKWTLTPLVPGVYPTVDEDGKEIVCPICKSERIVNDADGQPIIRKGSKHRVSDEWRCGDKGHTSCRGRWRAEFRRHQPNQEGRYAIRQKKLRNQVSPCLTHSLDSLFSACVMRQLRARGVRDLASVHDCWFLAETVWKDGTQLVGHGLELLEEAIRDAGKDWLLALGPVYDALEEAFRKAIPAMLDPTKAQQIEAVEHLALVIKAREAWKARVAAEDWPHFYATGDKETLVDPPELWNDPTMPEPWDTTTS